MTASVVFPAPALPPGPRRALVVATTDYTDAQLGRLRSPTHDAAALRSVLTDPSVGDFEVTLVENATAGEVRGAVVDFVESCGRHDLALVYLSCHGMLDPWRRLWFAARDTVKARMTATAVEASWLMDRMTDCPARQQVVILDCCFSGAFAQGAKGDDDAALERQLKAGGTVVLTASGATEYSFEGDPLAGPSTPSRFTAALVEGLRSGAADNDNDGLITVDDAYTFAHDQVVGATAGQTPQRWSFAAKGRIILARNPLGIRVLPATIPADLKAVLDHPIPVIRIAAVETLGEWLGSHHPAQVLAARVELRRIADEDLPRVGDRARALLGEPTSKEVGMSAKLAADLVDGAHASAKEIIRQAEEKAAKIIEEATQAGKAILATATKQAAQPPPVIRAPTVPARREHRNRPSGPPLSGICLLWIESYPTGISGPINRVRADGAVVHLVTDVRQAEVVVRQQPINALISDIDREGGAVGFDDLKLLRQAGYDGPAIFFTRRTNDARVQAAREAGAVGAVESADEVERWLRAVRDGLGRA